MKLNRLLVMSRPARAVFILCGLASVLAPLPAGKAWAGDAPSTASILTLDRIYDSDEFDMESAPATQWRKSGGYTVLEDVEGKKGEKQLVYYDPATSPGREVLAPSHLFIPPGESGALNIEEYRLSENGAKVLIYTNSKKVWRQKTRGDYWVLDLGSRELKKLGGDAKPSMLMFAEMSPDGSRVCYVRENNLCVQRLNDLAVTPLTRDGSATRINGTFDWVYEEELDLRKGFRWSPDSRSVAFWQTDSERVRVFHMINNTDGLYPRLIPIRYPKAGETNSSVRVGVAGVEGGEVRWLDVPGDPREHYIARMDWAESSDEIILQQFNRIQNTNRAMLADVKSGAVRTILTETDDAWVENENDVKWIEGGKRFLWLSDRGGWSHAYLVSRSGENMTLLTPGNFDVVSVAGIDEKSGWLYYIASPENPTQRYLYRVSLDGQRTERLSPASQAGTHHYNISPDAKWAIHTSSTLRQPPTTELIGLPDHKRVKLLTENQKYKEKLDALKMPAGEMFRVDIGKGELLDGWCLKPPDFDPAKKYPVLLHIYGEPTGQIVRDEWSGRGKGPLWHWMLAQHGYVIVSIDNRGVPAPRGRAWRKYTFRRLGVANTADIADATSAVMKQFPYMDASRIAVWGWSGGGTMTLNLLFRYPDLYHTGMAVAPVTNLRQYDTIYQERYMGLPGENAEGYRQGSAVTYAHQLKANLLLVHGTGDDNVHYQGAEQLINELIARNKHFTMMAYPNRSHGINEGKNTTRHLYELLTRYIEEQMPPGAK